MESHCEENPKSDVPTGRKTSLWGKSLEQTDFKQKLWEEAVNRIIGDLFSNSTAGVQVLGLAGGGSYDIGRT